MLQPNRKVAEPLRSCLILPLVAFLFLALIVALGDIKCAYDIENWWMPLYPNGETLDVQYDLFRPRAWGTTTWTMTTADDVETVKQYYRELRLETLQAGKTRGLAAGDSHVFPLDEPIAVAIKRLDSLNAGPPDVELSAEDLAAEIERATDWRDKLLRRQANGARSLVVLSSVCGI